MVEQVITRHDELRTLRGEWNDLLADSGANSIFLTWEWIAAWLEAVRPQAPLLVIALRDGSGRLAAVAPFYMTRMRLVRLMSFRCLRVLGDQDSGAEYPDLIIRRGCEEEALPMLRDVLGTLRRNWDCLWLPQVAGWTGARERFAQLTDGPARCPAHARPTDFGWLPLPTTHEAYLQTLSGNARSSLRRSAKRAAAAARAVEFVRCESAEQLPELLALLFDLHQRRWQAAGRPGCFGPQARLRGFYERFAPAALRAGWLRLYALKLDGVVRAVQYGYGYADTFYQLQEGYDPEAPEGIGNVLREYVFRASIGEGLWAYDFLGEYTEHKRRWGAVQREGLDLLIGRPALKNRLLFTRPVWPTGRFLREDRLPDAAAAANQTGRPSGAPAQPVAATAQ